jgi:glutamate N-acetyltransferase/amino-acid N-acetyltransferase
MSDELYRVHGFRFAGVRAGIKKNGNPDLAAIVCDGDASAAALFTTNLVKAAPVLVGEERMRRGRVRATLVNAGCANACTGKPGIAAAKATTHLFADALGLDDAEVIPASTGVIGAPLPVAKFEAAMPALVADLSPDHALHFADAICTTDRWRKVSDARVTFGKSEITALCIAKGAGMIHPNMATTLVFVVTDAKARSPMLKRALRDAAAGTMNAVSVDGDTSTNDMLLAMASGAAPNARPLHSPREASKLTELFESVLEPIARSIAADGEGSEHLVTIEVEGLATDAQAQTIARTIATSPLVKTALHGKDPNWGRILAAAGRAGVKFDPDKASIAIGDIEIVKNGMAVSDATAESFAHEVMRRPAYGIRVKLGRGKGTGRYITCDFGHGYVDVNANYRS